MAWFYGWSDVDVMSMDLDKANTYWEAITVIEAQDVLIKMKLADFPNMKKEDRSKWHRSVIKHAYPKLANCTPLSSEDAAKQIGALLNG